MKARWGDHIINFVSVILGVSLGFFISDIAERKKEQEELHFMMSALLEEIDEDLEIYEDYQIPDNQRQIEDLGRAIELLNTDVENDSLVALLSSGFNINSYFPQNIAFNSIVSSGRLELIEDLQLRKLLLEYQLDSKEVEAQGDAQYKLLMDQLVPWVIEHPQYLQEIKRGDDHSGMVILLTLYTSIISNKTGKYQDIVEEAKEIRKRLIDQENPQTLEMKKKTDPINP